MPRTNLVNAVDVELAAPVAPPDLTIEVDDAAPLPPVPFYLVVDPFNDTQGREYMLCALVVGTTLTVTRNLAGTDSDVHDTGDVVRITIAAQHIEDIWDGIEGIPPQTFLHADLTDVGALPSAHHPRYIDSEAVAAVVTAALFLPLAGGTMAGIINAGSFPLINLLGPTDPTDAANKAYVDSQDHDHATPIGVHAALPEVHHIRYTDAEAIAAVPPQTFLHADLTDVGSLPSAHHATYLDSEAVSANTGLWLPIGGGSLTGFLTLHADPTAVLHAAT